MPAPVCANAFGVRRPCLPGCLPDEVLTWVGGTLQHAELEKFRGEQIGVVEWPEHEVSHSLAHWQTGIPIWAMLHRPSNPSPCAIPYSTPASKVVMRSKFRSPFSSTDPYRSRMAQGCVFACLHRSIAAHHPARDHDAGVPTNKAPRARILPCHRASLPPKLTTSRQSGQDPGSPATAANPPATCAPAYLCNTPGYLAATWESRSCPAMTTVISPFNGNVAIRDNIFDRLCYPAYNPVRHGPG
ncbi:hypothetical protein F4780DRAFT_279174 [Xylariomycetidae sp. FL0641]|nr:hypothetical protein F4780DRAFT_279174 [Xylariomycetidae sp. FL0641]